jgi:hypothetical protein
MTAQRRDGFTSLPCSFPFMLDLVELLRRQVPEALNNSRVNGHTAMVCRRTSQAQRQAGVGTEGGTKRAPLTEMTTKTHGAKRLATPLRGFKWAVLGSNR